MGNISNFSINCCKSDKGSLLDEHTHYISKYDEKKSLTISETNDAKSLQNIQLENDSTKINNISNFESLRTNMENRKLSNEIKFSTRATLQEPTLYFNFHLIKEINELRANPKLYIKKVLNAKSKLHFYKSIGSLSSKQLYLLDLGSKGSAYIYDADEALDKACSFLGSASPVPQLVYDENNCICLPNDYESSTNPTVISHLISCNTKISEKSTYNFHFSTNMLCPETIVILLLIDSKHFKYSSNIYKKSCKQSLFSEEYKRVGVTHKKYISGAFSCYLVFSD